jgi:alkyl hydroperoxide reductase subunit AhpF
MQNLSNDNPFDHETWELLPTYFEKLPHAVRLHVWGDPAGTEGEREAMRLANALADRFDTIDAVALPRRVNYPFYPVLGIFGRDAETEEATDYGVRLIGLPSGYQMTSLIAAIQAVSFRGSTLESKTRFQLQGLRKAVDIELLTAADDQGGVLVAKSIFGLAVASPYIRAFLIMADAFPTAPVRYSAAHLPHIVINGRSHIEGVVEEEELLRKIAETVS